MDLSYRKIRVIILLVLLPLICLYPNPTMAQGYVVSSFSSPGTDPHGLTWDGEYLWNADNDINKIYKINSSTGAVVDSFDSPGPAPQGLAWDGQYLWNADVDNDKIYKINPSTGAVVDSFGALGDEPFGLAWDGQYLWHDDSGTDKIYKINPSTGAVVDSFDSPGSRPRGLAWDGQYLWNADSANDRIYKLDVGGSPIGLFSLSASPSSTDVVQGGVATFSISVDWTSGTPQTVYLSLLGVPDGCSYSFSPESGKPDFTSFLTVATTEDATLGTYILTIAGKSNVGTTYTTTVTLVIREYEPTTLEIIKNLITTPSVVAAIIGFIGIVITAIVGIIKLRKGTKSD